MPNTTTNFGYSKPLVNDATDEDLWGGYLNTNLDLQDADIYTAQRAVALSKSGTYTTVAGDKNKLILCDATAAAFSVNLLSAAVAGSGFRHIVKKTDATAHAVTIDAFGAETIDGALTLVLANQYDFATLVSDGTNWQVVTKPPIVAAASEATSGIAKLLSNAEFLTGTDTGKIPVMSNFAKSAAANGYITLPGGIILQWGSYTGGANRPTITFPTPFLSGVYSINCTSITPQADTFLLGSVGLLSFIPDQTSLSGAHSTSSFYWMAIGK